MQDLVRGEGKSELRRRAQHARGAAFEEGAETLFGVDSAGAVAQGGVFCLALTGLDLEACLDDVAGRSQISSRHTRDGAGGQQLHDAEFLIGAFAKHVALEVVVGWEIDSGEGNVTQQAGGGAFIEANQAEILHDPHGRAALDAFDGFGDFALDLEADFDDFEGVGEDLDSGQGKFGG